MDGEYEKRCGMYLWYDEREVHDSENWNSISCYQSMRLVVECQKVLVSASDDYGVKERIRTKIKNYKNNRERK